LRYATATFPISASDFPRPLRWSDLYCSRIDLQAFLPDLWPRFSGAIFFVSSPSLDGSDGYCDKMSAPSACAE
jgi:hypothetical protein